MRFCTWVRVCTKATRGQRDKAQLDQAMGQEFRQPGGIDFVRLFPWSLTCHQLCRMAINPTTHRVHNVHDVNLFLSGLKALKHHCEEHGHAVAA
jgi:hypothetical protein